MGGGGKGDSQETRINRDIAEASKPLIERGNKLADRAYQPNRGVQFAAFSPLQQMAMQGGADASNAFGITAPNNVMAGMPAPTMGNAGILGYGTGQVYDDNIDQSMTQSQQDYYNSFFRDPNNAYLDPIGGIDPNAPVVEAEVPILPTYGILDTNNESGGRR